MGDGTTRNERMMARTIVETENPQAKSMQYKRHLTLDKDEH